MMTALGDYKLYRVRREAIWQGVAGGRATHGRETKGVRLEKGDDRGEDEGELWQEGE